MTLGTHPAASKVRQKHETAKRQLCGSPRVSIIRFQNNGVFLKRWILCYIGEEFPAFARPTAPEGIWGLKEHATRSKCIQESLKYRAQRQELPAVPPQLTSELLHCLSTLPDPWPLANHHQPGHGKSIGYQKWEDFFVKTRERRGSSFSQLGLEPNHTGLTAQSLFFLEESCRVKRSDTQTSSNFSNYFKRVLKLQKRSSSFSK